MSSVATGPLATSIVRDDALLRDVEQFLYAEADLLDQWRLHEWLDLFPVGARYLVPSTDARDADPTQDLFLIQDDRFLLEQRVNSLLTRAAHAEYPHSRTRRLVTNVRVAFVDRDTIGIEANFAIHRMRRGAHDVYVGQYRHRLVRDNDHLFTFVERKAVLDLEALRPHGKVSIIL